MSKKVGRPKGTPKTGGRQKGTPNKATQSTRDWLNYLLNKNRVQFENDLQEIEPKERLSVLIKLLEYTTPKMQSVRANIDFHTLTEEQLDLVINELTKDIEL